jgi:hypothetical protein
MANRDLIRSARHRGARAPSEAAVEAAAAGPDRRGRRDRLQLASNLQRVDLTDPGGALKFAGTLDHPIAGPRG